jgi:hypothetical protein
VDEFGLPGFGHRGLRVRKMTDGKLEREERLV